MELIIKIPDEVYKTVQDGSYCGSLYEELKAARPYEPSEDLISRSDLKKEVVGMMINKADDLEEVEFEINATLASVCEKIDDAPPVPQIVVFTESTDEKAIEDMKAELQSVIEPRPKGEWILKETDCDDGGNNRYECTNCHYSDVHAGSAEVPYCWHCGAEMKGGAE